MFSIVTPTTEFGIGRPLNSLTHSAPAGRRAAEIDVTPEAERHVEAARVRQLEGAIERGEMGVLLWGGEADHANAGKPRRVGEVGMGGREKPAVLVAEDDQEAVE